MHSPEEQLREVQRVAWMEQREGASEEPQGPDRTPRSFQSDELFGAERLIIIQHSGKSYRLTITRNDKLILQK